MQSEPKRNLKLRYGLLSGFVVLLVLGWTGAWFFLRAELDRQLHEQIRYLSSRGVAVSCGQLHIGGFPFRFEVSCEASAVLDDLGRSAEAHQLRTVALVYKPWHIIAELAGPLRLLDPVAALTATADWESARTSVILSTTAVDRIDVSVEELDVSGQAHGYDFGFLADKAELHVRTLPGEPDTLEIFASLDALASRVQSAAGYQPDARVHLQIEEGAALLKGRPFIDLVPAGGPGLPIKIVWSSLEGDGSQLEISGQIAIDREGLLTGNLMLSLTGLNQLSKRLAECFPASADYITTVAGVALSLGEKVERDDGQYAIRLPIRFDRNRISTGVVPLGTLPPVRIGDG